MPPTRHGAAKPASRGGLQVIGLAFDALAGPEAEASGPWSPGSGRAARPLLGMKETVDVSESAATRTPGDMMVLYTDGITETSADRLADRLEGGDGAPRQALPAA